MNKEEFKANEIQKLRNQMYTAIKSYNKHMTDSYLNNLSTKAVIGLTSPLYREQWQDKFDKINETES